MSGQNNLKNANDGPSGLMIKQMMDYETLHMDTQLLDRQKEY